MGHLIYRYLQGSHRARDQLRALAASSPDAVARGSNGKMGFAGGFAVAAHLRADLFAAVSYYSPPAKSL